MSVIPTIEEKTGEDSRRAHERVMTCYHKVEALRKELDFLMRVEALSEEKIKKDTSPKATDDSLKITKLRIEKEKEYYQAVDEFSAWSAVQDVVYPN